MKYFRNGPKGPRSSAECTDNSCPCTPSVKFLPGEGFLYVSPEAVEFRRDAPFDQDVRIKMYELFPKQGPNAKLDTVLWSGIIICEQAAKLRNLDLHIASKDAKHWWKTGEIPLRPTPTNQKKDGSFLKARWWQIWK